MLRLKAYVAVPNVIDHEGILVMFQRYVIASSVASQMFIYRKIVQKNFRMQCLSKHGLFFKMLRLTRSLFDSNTNVLCLTSVLCIM